MLKLNTKFNANLLLYSHSHFECDGHTLHMLTQWHLLFPLTSTVQSSLFTHVHSSALSSAARLQACCVNCSHYINDGCIFSGPTSYVANTFPYPVDFPFTLLMVLFNVTQFVSFPFFA